jgi:hypothetical protein
MIRPLHFVLAAGLSLAAVVAAPPDTPSTAPAATPAPKATPAPAPKKPVAPAPKPKPKLATSKPVAKPAPSKGDIALAAARKCDTNKSGSLSGEELTGLRAAFRDPKNFLDLYDENGSGFLDDQEISKLNAKLRELKEQSRSGGSKEKSAKKK